MPLLIQYFVKLFISFAVVYLFYQLLLRRLTFYNSNRWYLLAYTLLCFFIPFIDISPVVNSHQLDTTRIIQFIPSVETYTARIDGVTDCPAPVWSSAWDKWDWLLLVFIAGAGFLLLRLLFRFISFFRLRRKAKLISSKGIKLFHVDDSIIPFSFGNAVFFNRHLHNEDELREIVRHEFVHVKQKHTIDIIWGEILCILNWYNPFAWLIKAAIRQNLEFIADDKVLGNGINKKQYQYLLLKVIGNNHFSIANQFNFSSLKKRIAMMNKMQTAKVQLLRFLFILPLLAIILVSFRKQIGGKAIKQEPARQVNPLDSIPSGDWTPVPTESEKDFLKRHPKIKEIRWGYITSVQSNAKSHTGNVPKIKAGDAFMTIYFTNGKWDMYNLGSAEDVEKFKKNYGEMPPAPPAPPTGLYNDKGYHIRIEDDHGNCTVVVTEAGGKEVDRLLLTKWDANAEYYEGLYGEILPPEPPEAPEAPEVVALPDMPEMPRLPKNVKTIYDVDGEITVTLKDGTKEKYNMSIPEQRAAFEKKYGEIVVPVEPATPAPPKQRGVALLGTDGTDHVAVLCDDYEITNKKAVMHLKNGKTEEYDLTNINQRRQFEKKYGRIINVNNDGDMITPVAVVNHGSGYTVVAPKQQLM